MDDTSTWFCAWCLRDKTDEDVRHGTEAGYLCRPCYDQYCTPDDPED